MNLRKRLRTIVLSVVILLIYTATLQAFGLKDQNPDPAQYIDEYKRLSEEYYNIDTLSLKEEVDWIKQLYNISVLSNNDSTAFYHSYDLSSIYYDLDSIEASYDYALLAIGHLDRVEINPVDEAFLFNNIGTLYSHLGDHDEALVNYYKALSLMRSADSPFQVYSLGNISDTYGLTGDYDQALKHSMDSYLITQNLEGYEYFYNVIYDYSSISEWNVKLNNKSLAEQNYRLLQDIEDTLYTFSNYEKDYLLDSYYSSITHLSLELKKYDDTKRYLRLAKKFALNYSTTGITLLEAKLFYQTNNYEELEAILSNNSLANSDSEIYKEWLELKLKFYKEQKDSEKVIDTFDEIMVNNSQLEQARSSQLSKLSEAKYELLEQNRIISLLEQKAQLNNLKISSHRYQLISLGLLVLIVLGIISYLYVSRKKKDEYASQLESEVYRKTNDLKTLNESLTLKNEELKQFNYMIAHDLKEPIRSIVGFTKLLGQHTTDNQTLKSYTDIIQKSGTQLNDLVNDFQMFQTLDVEIELSTNCELDEVITEIKGSLKTVIDHKGAQIVSTSLPRVKGQKSLLFVVFQNLIENGLKYNKSDMPSIQMWNSNDGDIEKIYIKDNGIGIDKKYHNEIFKMFKRLHTRSEYAGTGIGLSTTQKLLNKLGGTIEILHSEINNGTTFCISLPKA